MAKPEDFTVGFYSKSPVGSTPGRSGHGELREAHGADVNRRIYEKTVDAAFEAVDSLLQDRPDGVRSARVVCADFEVCVEVFLVDVFRNISGFIHVPIATGLTSAAAYSLLCEAVRKDD